LSDVHHATFAAELRHDLHQPLDEDLARYEQEEEKQQRREKKRWQRCGCR
jgi:hypothetical protein